MIRYTSVLVLLLASAVAAMAQSASPAVSPAASASPAASPEASPAASPAAEASVAPPVVTGDKLYSPSGEFTITLPAGWAIADKPKKGSDCDVETKKEADVFIEHSDKEHPAGEYATLLIEGMKKNGAKCEEKSRKDVTIAGLKGVQVHFTAVVEGSDLEYLMTILQDDKKQYEITGLATKASWEATEKELNAVTDSFKPGKP